MAESCGHLTGPGSGLYVCRENSGMVAHLKATGPGNPLLCLEKLLEGWASPRGLHAGLPEQVGAGFSTASLEGPPGSCRVGADGGRTGG